MKMTSKRLKNYSLRIDADLLEKFADWSGCDLYILPSSIHEVLLLRDDEIWFCNKASDGSSKYSSITDYTGIRKETSRKKLYQADKFGALPNVNMNALRELFRATKNR